MRQRIAVVLAVVLGMMGLQSGAAGAPAEATVRRQGQVFRLSGPGYSAEFSAENGALLALRQAGRSGSLLRSGAQGLWSARFREGRAIAAQDFRAGSAGQAFTCRQDARAGALHMEYRSPALVVRLVISGRKAGLEFAGLVRPASGVLLDFTLPARLRFEAGQVQRFVCPSDGNQGVGVAFRRAFFLPQSEDRPSAWRQEPANGAGSYAALYGGPLDQRADQDPPTALAVTPEGRQWLGESLAQRLEGAKATVNRPPTRAQAPVLLVDSPNGPWLSASPLGGSGALWRIGGAVGDAEKSLALDAVAAVVGKLAAAPSAGRARIGVLAMRNGPEQGGWAAVPVRAWIERFRQLPAVLAGKAQVVALETPRAMGEALRSGDFLAILNPYGEGSPVLDGGMPATIEAVGRFVRAGGNWLEVGGYPFFYALRPVRFFTYDGRYPPMFADFMHLDSQAGSADIYRVQPLTAAPWAGARDHRRLFVPGALGCGADAEGGYCDRSYAVYVAPGEEWTLPRVRVVVGGTAEAGLAAYCRANAIRRGLADKMSRETLERFRRSVLVYYAGSAEEKTAHLERLPVPALIHFADYLHGGFDKQYPDHLPPNPAFGTPEAFRAFFDRAHALGHLVMPYTNPTWWCDHPKGPTFEREGDAPLLKLLDGKPAYERYGVNDGWTICHWHPAVQAANRRTVRQFTDDYPVDVLFQDQCGARSWNYDLNPASPTPWAYTDGLLSMISEDSKTKPLSTESGWDRVVNAESQLCGLSWGLVPTEYGPEWRRYMKQVYPPETWDIYPLAQRIAHDRTSMLYHDLGQFVTNPEIVAWTLGLGFGMSYTIRAPSLREDGPREWLYWLDRLQKSVCARYVGAPVRGFIHDRGPAPTVEDDGLIRAAYGPVRVTANLGPRARVEEGRELAPHGFVATAPGLVAAHLQRLGDSGFGEEGLAFVAESGRRQTDLWIYAPPEQPVVVELPAAPARPVTLAFDGGARAQASGSGRLLSFRLPARPGLERVRPPAALADRAPRDWPGTRPAVGVLNLAGSPAQTWTRITPEDWLRAFRESRLATAEGVPVRAITTLAELYAALDAGPTAWFAIVNPYGEGIPETAPGQWRETLDRIRRYVEHGGCWWETAGYTFHAAFAPTGDGWQSEQVGPGGLASLGLPVGGGEIDAAPSALQVTPEGREWLGDALSAAVAQRGSPVNRALPRGANVPGHFTLVTGARQDYIGGYRLKGWGWLWRIGGFWPDPQVALPVVVAATDYLFTHAPRPAAAGETRYLWHAVLPR